MAYNGERILDVRHGSGLYVYKNKFFTYEGEWKDGEKHGKGKLSLANGIVIEARFVMGEIEGNGKKTWPDGSTYIGNFTRGEMNGKGVYRGSDGEVYEGEYVGNARQGTGRLQTRTSDVFEGNFDRNKPHGRGIWKYANGDCYEGFVVHGVLEGKGTMKYSNGLSYSGEWKSNKWHGEGRLYNPSSGLLYSGQFVDGNPDVAADRMECVNLETIEIELGAVSLPKIILHLVSSANIHVTGESGRLIVASYKKTETVVETPRQKNVQMTRKKSMKDPPPEALQAAKRAPSPSTGGSKTKAKSDKERATTPQPVGTENQSVAPPQSPQKSQPCPFDNSTFPPIYTIPQRVVEGVACFDML
eukprot:TRINITY_DN6264_c0_g1_i5.p1 TRINITY_DN6264_c0_g1~~TRINITY_DN6264_c0_g1_i5.p1  ORF type:complete len:358 (+),score=55.08 TRINITY_DN6264_c0_g1_i5:104-1177(+)